MPLHGATEKGHADLGKILLDHGADPDVEDRSGDTPQYLLAPQYCY
jgi:ankyrin repeat protein